MSQQQEQIQSTTDKPTNRSRRTRFGGNHVSMLSAKGSSIPIPVQNFNKKLGIVDWGKKNEYPYFLNYLAKTNPIHGGILNAKTYFSVSGGIIYEGSNQEGYEQFFKNKKTNYKDKDLEKIAGDISRSFEKSNLAVVKIIFNQVGNAKTYRKIDVIPFEKVRFEAFEKDNEIFLSENIKVSNNWFDEKANVEIISPYNKYDTSQRVCYAMIMIESGQSIDDPSRIRQINPGIYPDPTYSGSIVSIDTGIKTIQYGNSEITNGFSLGTLIYLAGGKIKDEDAKRDLERDLGASTTGPLQAGRSMVIYGNGQNEKPTIDALNGNNLPDRYNNAKQGSEESTVQGHSLTTPILAGVKTEGSMGNATELKIGYEIFKQNYITARQDEIIALLNWIMNEVAGVEGTLKFGEVVLNLPDENSNPQFQVNLSKEVESKDDKDIILERLKKTGTSRDKFEVLHTMGVENGMIDKDTILSDFKKSFADLTDEALKVLGLINSGEGYDSIRSTLDMSTQKINEIYKTLESEGLINDGGEITTAGKRAVAVAEVESITVMYSYGLRPDAPALVKGGSSRPFCQELMSLDRLYSREDIAIISGIEGYDVFAYRGGWYHNPNTDKNEPGCRHQWRSELVFKD